MFSDGEADHPVLQMRAALQRRGAASPSQPLPHKMLHLQGSVTRTCGHVPVILQTHLSQKRHVLPGKLSGGPPVADLRGEIYFTVLILKVQTQFT